MPGLVLLVLAALAAAGAALAVVAEWFAGMTTNRLLLQLLFGTRGAAVAAAEQPWPTAPPPPSTPSTGLMPGGASLAAFGICAATTHLCSSLTHVFPDNHSLVRCHAYQPLTLPTLVSLARQGKASHQITNLVCGDAFCRELQEKFDHVGIVATIVGTPITALMVIAGSLRGWVSACFKSSLGDDAADNCHATLATGAGAGPCAGPHAGHHGSAFGSGLPASNATGDGIHCRRLRGR